MVSRKSFANPNHFTKEADGWVCNICPSTGDHAHSMNIHAAIRHERGSAQHARSVLETNMWWNPPAEENAAISWLPPSQDAAAWNAPLEEDPPLTKEELQMREHQYHVERVADIVPYWIKCVNAAANGEELRLEPFLNTLHDVSDSWMDPANPWAQATGSGWDDRGDTKRWGVPPDAKSMSSAHVSKSQTGSRTTASSVAAAGYAFVENIARQESVTDVDRKRRMHMFFEMPTNEKIQKIDEIVRYLQSASV
ncbi:hypothetical protein B0H19DRAFT_621702 [Mycena capillaripes]|nr:hypothetical protein B0H19DRAFT_621702 [Mycena capillaripes]